MMYGSIHSHFESDKDAVNAHFGSNGRISFEQALDEYHKLGAKKVAVTEHGAFSSFEDIYAASKKYDDMDVIPGVEAYFDYKEDGENAERTHLILIAKDAVGYQQLCKIITRANKNIWQSKAKKEYPIVTMSSLEEICGENPGHILCSSACIAGPFGTNFGLEKKNIDERIARHKEKLDAHDYFTKKEVIDAFNEMKAHVTELLPDPEDVKRANETKDVVLKKAQTQMRRDATEYKKSDAYVNTKAAAEAAQKYISKHRLGATIAAYNAAVTELEDYQANLNQNVYLEEAKKVFKRLVAVFGADFYFELQNHHLPSEKDIYNRIVKFAFHMNHAQFIASNDVHIAMHKSNPEFNNEVERRNVAKHMRFGSYDSLDEPDTYEYGIKTDEELREELLAIIEPITGKNGNVISSAEAIVNNAIKNIKSALEKCKAYEPIKEDHYPKFAENDNELLEKLVQDGINSKFNGKLPNKEYEDRLRHELNVIESMGYASYHLIVQDYLTYGRLLGYLPPEEVADAPLTIEELDAYITEKGYPRIGYSIGPGRGCSVPDGLVYTSGGVKEIKDMCIGDTVYDMNGKPAAVKDVLRYYIKEPMVELTIAYGGKVTFTPDHKFLVCRHIPEDNKMRLAQGCKYKDNVPQTKAEWVQAGSLNCGDWLMIPRLQTEKAADVPVYQLYGNQTYQRVGDKLTFPDYSELKKNQLRISDITKATGLGKSVVTHRFHNGYAHISTKLRVRQNDVILQQYLSSKGITIAEWQKMIKQGEIPAVIPLTEALSYLFGYYIADGWTHNGSVYLAYNTETEQDYKEKLIQAIRAAFGEDIPVSTRRTKGKCFSVIIHCSSVVDLFQTLLSGDAHTKRVPKDIFTADATVQKAFLQGAFDGDGSYKDISRAKYTTVNKNLVYDIKRLLIMNGIPTVVKESFRTDKFGERMLYDIGIPATETSIQIFPKLQIPDNRPNNLCYAVDEKYIYMRVKESRTFDYVGDVYDLTIDTSAEPSYCTIACVVHNSAAGSLVCYSLGITDIDPIRYNLLFERFLNPERVSMPKQHWASDVNPITQGCEVA